MEGIVPESAEPSITLERGVPSMPEEIQRLHVSATTSGHAAAMGIANVSAEPSITKLERGVPSMSVVPSTSENEMVSAVPSTTAESDSRAESAEPSITRLERCVPSMPEEMLVEQQRAVPSLTYDVSAKTSGHAAMEGIANVSAEPSFSELERGVPSMPDSAEPSFTKLERCVPSGHAAMEGIASVSAEPKVTKTERGSPRRGVKSCLELERGVASIIGHGEDVAVRSAATAVVVRPAATAVVVPVAIAVVVPVAIAVVVPVAIAAVVVPVAIAAVVVPVAIAAFDAACEVALLNSQICSREALESQVEEGTSA